MRCPACNADNSADNRHCESCGARLPGPCPRCGRGNSAAAHFCGYCGASLDHNQESAPHTRARPRIRAERKYATVLFADIVGSTELIAGMDPEQAMERLRPAVATMCDVVERFEGTVVRTLGDGIMALFGAPHAQEGHALLACESALAIQDAFPLKEGALQLRVGLHSGDVVSDIQVAELLKGRAAHGATIHLASRLQSVADPGNICITDDCHRLVRPYCDVRPLGKHALKGFAEPIEVYALLGLKPAVASQQFRGTNLTTFRGRSPEISNLRRALQRTEDGETCVVGISGDPGTGKSRLCYEFAEWCRSRLIPVFEARALPYGHATPLQPVLELLRLFFGILPADSAVISRDRVVERLSKIGATFEADLPLLCEFLGIPVEPRRPLPLSPKARHARLLDIVRHLVRQNGARTGVIVIEDLHWLDEASKDFVATLVDAAAGTRTMLVLNYRPSYVEAWMDLPYFEQLSLAELSLSDTDDLVEELIGSAAELSEMRRSVVERSGGNAFFAEELVRSLVENSSLIGDAGDYKLGWKGREDALPPTLQAVIGARIDRLGDAEKSIVQIGAVIGKEFPLTVLEQIGEVPGDTIAAVLDRLCEAELLKIQLGGDGRWYAFRHPLIQEVAYASQLRTRRSTLHASVARAMERHYEDRLDEFAALLAYHFEAAGQTLHAARYARRAAMWVGSTNSAQAIKHWQTARLLMQDQERSPPNDNLRIMASAQIAWLGWREGMTAEAAKPFIEEALAWARETDDTMIPLLLFLDGRIILATGGPADTYVERVKEALSLLEQGTAVGRTAMLNASLSQAYAWAGMLREALAASDAALDAISGIDKFDHEFLGYSVEHWTMTLRGRILLRLGRFAEAEACLDTMLSIEPSLVDPTVQIIPHMGYVELASCRGNAALAEQHAWRVAEIAGKSRSPYLRVYALAGRGAVKYLLGDFEGAAMDFREGLELSRTAKAARENEPEMLASLADCYYQAGDHAAAITTAREAIAIARQRSARLPECRACITCGGAVLAAHGAAGLEEVEDHFRRAADLISVSGAAIYEQRLALERAHTMTLTC